MKALLVSHSDGGGGAGRASFRLHRALRANGVDSRMLVDFTDTDDPFVTRPSGLRPDLTRRLRILADQAPGASAKVADAGLFSPGWAGAITARSLDRSGADVINIHWINMGFMSIRQLGRITTPCVWTLHDMWAFTGGRHYDDEGALTRWRSTYGSGNQPRDDSRWDVDRWVWAWKRRQWRRPHHIVTPSSWLAGLARDSELLGDWPIRVIPNPLDTEVYRPLDGREARTALGLPQDAPLILFTLTTDLDDPRKGWDLLRNALLRLRPLQPDAQLVVMGHTQPPGDWPAGLPATHWLGRLTDDRDLVRAYSAADVAVVPSRQDNLPQTGTEAQACGTPVVAFRIGGLPDVVDHEVTGFLASPYDTSDLTEGIAWVLADRTRRAALSAAARARAERLWSPQVVAQQYVEEFESASI